MIPLELMFSVCISVLQLEGISGDVSLFYRPGQSTALPCIGKLSSEKKWDFDWFYNREPSKAEEEVKNGCIVQSSPRASRMTLDPNFSLVIYNLTADDAGAYTCYSKYKGNTNSYVYVNILTVSLSPLDADPRRDGSITLQCSLWRYRGYGPCPRDSVQWVDETGTVLLGEGIGYKTKQTGCVSTLIVRLSGFNRRYTCQFVEMNNTVIYAEYTPVFTGNSPVVADCTNWTFLSLFTLILRATGVFLMTVISLLYLKNKVSKTCGRKGNNHRHAVNYENVRAPAAASNLH
ncbi:uncharacterized protein LOC115415280 [Sphaeramia orbicularis]|uniref:uncharacterized protein LOC115415280 n=1 Tax=Sphaeramia orbicularis TaxID=375764 RepID=UPI00117F83BD|nr:uncharacterized protein LOC115415280 [Sphaeramia orbicularis]